MQQSVLSATKPWDTAVELTNVSKTFYQRQPGTTLRGMLHPTFRKVNALADVSFSIKRGEFCAYAGPNGAGKSTTFKLMCGMLAPQSGEIRTMGYHPQKDRIAVMKRLGVLFGGRSELWWDHPVIGSFEWKRGVWSIPHERYKENLKRITDLLDLGPFMGSYARELSLGQRMRAELGLMLLHDPEVIFLDEPTLGMDVISKQQMIAFLKSLNREEGTTILVTSHDMDDLTAMAKRLLLISDGKIAFDGSYESLMQRTGDERELLLTCSGSVPAMPLARLVRLKGEQHTFAFAGKDASSILRSCVAAEGIRDIEMRHRPLEEVIANLYLSWRK